MDSFLATLQNLPVAETLRISRWGYATVNAAHIFGIALLVGAVLPLNMRLLGLWTSVPRPMVLRILVPCAAAGLVLTITAGLLLFSVRAREYAGIGFLQAKLVLVAVAIVSALILHYKHGWLLETASKTRIRGHAILSTACWLGALVCGRFIAFAGS